MNVLSAFLDRCRKLSEDGHIAWSTLSTKLFGSGTRLDQIAGGSSDIGVKRLAAAEKILAHLEKQYGVLPEPGAERGAGELAPTSGAIEQAPEVGVASSQNEIDDNMPSDFAHAKC